MPHETTIEESRMIMKKEPIVQLQETTVRSLLATLRNRQKAHLHGSWKPLSASFCPNPIGDFE